MTFLFFALWIACTVMFILGMINPQKALIPYAKKGKKQVFLTWFITGFVFFVIFLVMVVSQQGDAQEKPVVEKSGNPTETVEESTPEPKTETVEESTPEPKIETAEESTPEPSVQQDEVDEDVMVDLGLLLMRDSFHDFADIEADKALGSYKIIFTDDSIITAINLLSIGDESLIESWDDMVESLRVTSKTVYETTEYMVSIANPHETDNIILILMNGIVVYDFMDDIK
jgi:hypothetical protein